MNDFGPIRDYVPFLIKIGKPGAYSENMDYDRAFNTYSKYNLVNKHSQYKVFPKIKNVVSQTWKDEQGDDTWLPPTGVMSEAYDFVAEFIYYEENSTTGSEGATESIHAFANEIKGKWLQIYDTYTGIGRKAVYVQEFDDDPKFIRRKRWTRRGFVYRDYVHFKVKFRCNDPKNITLNLDEE